MEMGNLTERGAAAFWRRDGDGGTAERGILVFSEGGAASLFLFSKDEQGLRLLH